jgi:hypothetical protein
MPYHPWASWRSGDAADCKSSEIANKNRDLGPKSYQDISGTHGEPDNRGATIADCHYWMGSCLVACLTGSDQELWQAFTIKAREKLLDYERAALAESALASLPLEDRLEVARASLGSEGPPRPAFLSGMSDARSWAGRATRAELKAFALASFEAMPPGDQSAFLTHVTPASDPGSKGPRDMKMIVNREPIASGLPFHLDEVQAGLRADDPDFMLEVQNLAQAAALELESFAQIALLSQTIRVVIFDPVQQYTTRLPIGPVAQDHVPEVTFDGEPFTEFEFEGGNRPSIRWLAPYYELSPSRIAITYTAGFGDKADSIPRDLAHAVIDQACFLFDARSPGENKGATHAPHMARIGARYRGVGL